MSIAFVTGYIGFGIPYIPKLSQLPKNADAYFMTNNPLVINYIIESKLPIKPILIPNIKVLRGGPRLRKKTGKRRWDRVKILHKNTLHSKSLKVFPQKFIGKKYDFIIWHDNKIEVNIKDTVSFIKNWNNNFALAVHKHPICKNVKHEFKLSQRQRRYQIDLMKNLRYIKKCQKKNLVVDYKFHAQTGFIIYNLTNPVTFDLQNRWFNHIKRCGIECQISFNLFRQTCEEYICDYPFNIYSESSDEYKVTPEIDVPLEESFNEGDLVPLDTLSNGSDVSLEKKILSDDVLPACVDSEDSECCEDKKKEQYQMESADSLHHMDINI